jgi:excisionase family DNA binding protein
MIITCPFCDQVFTGLENPPHDQLACAVERIKHLEAELLSVAQVAEALHTSEEYVRRELRSGALRAYKIGGWRVSRGDLAEYMEARCNDVP